MPQHESVVKTSLSQTEQRKVHKSLTTSGLGARRNARDASPVAEAAKSWYICPLKKITMASLFNFGFFGNQPHRVFNYKPRYYDPEEEKRKQMFGDVDGTNDKAREEGSYVPGSSLRGAFRNGNYQKTRSSMSTAHTIITIVTLVLIVVVLIYMAKFFELL